ncbi:MAG: NlpC/P60 family protein [Capsulimonadales bacterium]|nr:NlpC/P60 family protein [Capsulimonadales bacterium]
MPFSCRSIAVLSAVCLPLLSAPLGFVRSAAAQTEESATTLTMTLDTGAPATPPKRNTGTTGPAGKTSAPTRRRVTSAPLASRNGIRSLRQPPMNAPQVPAQLACVVSEQAELRVGVEPSSRLLSKIPQGTYVAVIAETDAFWGVLMINKTIGWTPKSDLELMDYQTRIPVPQESEGSETAGGTPEYPETGEAFDERIRGVLREAYTYLGVPYVWGGNTRNGLDCSAFVRSCFRTQGVDLARHSGHQITRGRAIFSGNDLRPGDRLYFDCSTRRAGIDHTGIYVGRGLFIHASGSHGRVVVESLIKPVYVKGLVAIRRDFE